MNKMATTIQTCMYMYLGHVREHQSDLKLYCVIYYFYFSLFQKPFTHVDNEKSILMDATKGRIIALTYQKKNSIFIFFLEVWI